MVMGSLRDSALFTEAIESALAGAEHEATTGHRRRAGHFAVEAMTRSPDTATEAKNGRRRFFDISEKLSYDCNRKASLYARAGIADYWIVNLVNRQLEVFRNPVADNSQPSGFRYADATIVAPGASVSPLAVPVAKIVLADLLP